MVHAWEKSYPSGVQWDHPLPPAVPLETLLETAATTWPDRIAIDFYDRTFTYRELHQLAARVAKGLQTLGMLVFRWVAAISDCSASILGCCGPRVARKSAICCS